MTKWLKDVGGPFKGTKFATPPKQRRRRSCSTRSRTSSPSRPASKSRSKSSRSSRFSPRPSQDVQGQLGTYDIYYLDQSWMATFAPDTVDPVQYYKDKPDLAMPGFDFDDFSAPLVEGSRGL